MTGSLLAAAVSLATDPLVVLAAAAVLAVLAGMTAAAWWAIGAHAGGGPPFAGPNQYARPPEVVAERHARALDRNRDHAHAALDRITTTMQDGGTP